jgi:formiminotetrahydrofolate cyclodeaminase
MEVCFDSLSLIHEMAKKGNPNSITDVGVAMFCIKAAINGAFLNVRINCNDLKDKDFIKETLSKANEILKITDLKEKEVLKIVDEKL